MEKRLLMVITVFPLLFVIFKILAIPACAVPWPPSIYCTGTMRYEEETTPEGRFCVFPDGSMCEMQAFYDGECGQEFIKELECSTGTKLPGMECCPGYISRPQMKVYPDGSCGELAGWALCLPCGNGVCDERENICNCPEDCKEQVIPEVVSNVIKRAIPQESPSSSSDNYYALGAGFVVVLVIGTIILVKRGKYEKRN